MSAPQDGRTGEPGPAPVLVGVDGSPGSRAALAWALPEAAARGCGVRVVAAFPLATAWSDAFATRDVDPSAVAARRAREQLAEVRATPVPDVAAAVEAVPGDPGEELVRRSADAALLVVGSRGRSALAGTVLGSVSLACVAGARCPVVVVPANPAARARDRVVVGFDGSPESAEALEVGLATAARRGWPEVEVVTAFSTGDHWADPDAVGGRAAEEVASAVREQVTAAVGAALERVRAGGRPLPAVRTTVLEGRADDVLVGLSQDARLLVLGSRGRGALRRALLGSVAVSCTARGHVPTLVVPAAAVPARPRAGTAAAR